MLGTGDVKPLAAFFFYYSRLRSNRMNCFCGRCLPMNLRAEDLASGVLRDRVKVGASLADVDPMNLDTSVSICYEFQTRVIK